MSIGFCLWRYLIVKRKGTFFYMEDGKNQKSENTF